MPVGELSRRGFLGGAAALSVSPLVPKTASAKTVTFRAPPPVVAGNQTVMPNEIAREALSLLQDKLTLSLNTHAKKISAEIEAPIAEAYRATGGA